MFVIIVLFLIANFSATGEVLKMTKDIQLPRRQREGVEIGAGGHGVATTEVMHRRAASVGRVEDLVARTTTSTSPRWRRSCASMKKQSEDLHAMANDGTAFKGDVNIQANKDVPFRIIKRVMFSCAGGGYGNINFAVLRGTTGGRPARRPPRTPKGRQSPCYSERQSSRLGRGRPLAARPGGTPWRPR